MSDYGEVEQLERPQQAVLLAQWAAFFGDPLLSLPHLKHKAITGHLDSRGLRSLHWRYYFSLLPSPSATSTSSSSTYALFLGRSRAEYAELRDRFLRSPDGGWVADGETEGGTSKDGRKDGRKASTSTAIDVNVNNPLSQEPSNLWGTWFDDLELRRTIRQDVKRTFPEIDYFREPETQDKMTDLLFILCKLSPEIGYRQGMHELLAPLLWAVDFDSLVPSGALDSLPHLVLARDYVEHDTWSLFSALMKTARTLYDHTPSVPLPVDRAAASSTTSLTLAHAAGTSSTIVLVQPIVGTAIRIHDKLLQTIDPLLWAKMEKLRVEPQLYAIRWLRLVFGREFPIVDTLQLWDGLFAEDTSLRLMEYICIAMLLRIRDALLASDYSGFLQLLLRYPSPPDGNNRIPLLLQQAILLRDNVSEQAGERCREQNAALGATAGVASGDDRDDDDDRDRRGSGRRGSNRQSVVASPQPQMGAAAALLAEGGGFVGDIAKGVYGRAEAMGINKAIFGTFNDYRRAANPPPRDNLSEIPNRLPWDRPATPVRDYLSEIARLKASNLAMSKAIGLCVGVAERELVVSHGNGTADEQEPPSQNALFAMTALKHVRDVLAGHEGSFDPNVLTPLLHSLNAAGAALPTSPPLTSSSSSSLPPNSAPAPTPSPKPATTSMARSDSAPSRPPSSTPPLLPPISHHRPSPSLSRVPQLSSPSPPPSLHSTPTPQSRPIPPWESHRLGQSFARLPESTPSAALPRQPPSASVGRATRQPQPQSQQATFPPTSFSVRSPTQTGGERKSGKTPVVVDPLGAMS